MEAPDFLPLGSVVTLIGNSEKRLMVVGRAMAVDDGHGVREYYDYALVLYPEGLMGDAAVYSNHDCVDVVVHRGFSDDEDAALLEGVRTALAAVDLPKADPRHKGVW